MEKDLELNTMSKSVFSVVGLHLVHGGYFINRCSGPIQKSGVGTEHQNHEILLFRQHGMLLLVWGRDWQTGPLSQSGQVPGFL